MPRSQRPRQGKRPLYILPQPNDVPVTTCAANGRGARTAQPLSLSSLEMYAPSPADSRPVSV